MEMQIPNSVPNPEKVYYKEVLLKKEASRVWTEYYAVLCDRFLIFNRRDRRSGKFIENNCTMLELIPSATVGYLRKTCYRFPFYIKMGKLNYHFKCETNFQRYRWVFTLRLAIAGKPPEPPPKFIPTRYSRGKLARREDKLSLKNGREVHTPRGNHTARLNGHSNGHCARSNENLADSEEEHELNHSSHAVRLQKNKDSLLLTNKSAIFNEEASGPSLFEARHRKLSFADNDLEIVDFEDADNSDETNDEKMKRDRTKSTISNGSQTKKKTVSINDCPTDMEQDHIDRSQSTAQVHEPTIAQKLHDLELKDHLDLEHLVACQEKKYRIYPDNVKSHSWTSLQIMRKHPVPRRENSAPPATRRERRMNRKNMVEKFCQEADC